MHCIKLLAALLAATTISGTAMAGDDKDKNSGYTTYSSKGFGSKFWGKTVTPTPPKSSSSSSGGSSSGGHPSSSGGGSSGGAPTPVPEPTTIALMGTGLGLLALRRRRRKA